MGGNPQCQDATPLLASLKCVVGLLVLVGNIIRLVAVSMLCSKGHRIIWNGHCKPTTKFITLQLRDNFSIRWDRWPEHRGFESLVTLPSRPSRSLKNTVGVEDRFTNSM